MSMCLVNLWNKFSYYWFFCALKLQCVDGMRIWVFWYYDSRTVGMNVTPQNQRINANNRYTEVWPKTKLANTILQAGRTSQTGNKVQVENMNCWVAEEWKTPAEVSGKLKKHTWTQRVKMKPQRNQAGSPKMKNSHTRILGTGGAGQQRV